jgi:hypothetical protein
LFGAELGDACEGVVPRSDETPKVVGGLTGFAVGERRLGDERADASILRHVLLEHDLFVEDPQLGLLLRDLLGESRQPFADVQGEARPSG